MAARSFPASLGALVESTYGLEECLPPSGFQELSGDLRPADALVIAHGQSLCEAIGRHLGGADEATERRWQHLEEDPAALEAINRSVGYQHIFPACYPLVGRERAAKALQLGGRLVTTGGAKTLLAPRTHGWRLLRALARAFHRQDDEDDEAHLVWCRRCDAWAHANAYEKPGVAVVVLRQATALLAGDDVLRRTPGGVRISEEVLGAFLRVPPAVRLECPEVVAFIVPWGSGHDEPYGVDGWLERVVITGARPVNTTAQHCTALVVTESNGHYSTAACPRVHCRALQLYSTLQHTTALQLYSVYTLQHSAPPL